ncbi:peptidase M23 [Streptomyces sp. NPDC089919]|uniref:peptidase M23 n=1 Tax=Streptomyces sp. NPDC089919 TaxID=3155188 RepID=UPI003416B52B
MRTGFHVGTLLAVLSVVCVLGVGVGGSVIAGPPARAEGCPGPDPDGPGAQGAGGAPAGERFRGRQVDHARIIDRVAAEGGLSGRATLVGLMAALQESSLMNLDHGDRDSLGLFQQRPSRGWGSGAQIMQPRYAAQMFFYGASDGDPRGLTGVPGWEAMEPGRAAQAVQRSAYPELYGGQEAVARRVARAAGLDLHRPGTRPGRYGPPAGVTLQGTPARPDRECPQQPGAVPARYAVAAGAAFHDGPAGWPAGVRNPRTTAGAVDWARDEAAHGGPRWYRACLAFVAESYGWRYSGVLYAVDHYRTMPPGLRHDHDRDPPPGALMYWDTGRRAGHVALYLGAGKIASNDITRPGRIDVVDAAAIESRWHATYLGWAPPYFPKAG